MSIENLNIINNFNPGINIKNRPSYFQIKYFIIESEPTLQSKMWRCLKEIEVRKESIKVLNSELDELKDNLLEYEIENNLLENKHTSPQTILEINKRRINRKIEAIKNNISTTENKINDVLEEIVIFINEYNSMNQVQKCKEFDDQNAQMEYWEQKLNKQLNTKLLLNEPIGTELVNTIMALPDKFEVKQGLNKLLDILYKNAVKNMNLSISKDIEIIKDNNDNKNIKS